MRVYIVTNADCTRRRLDASLLKEFFSINGWELARTPRSAELIVVVTCSYTEQSEDMAIEMVRRFGAGEKTLIVAGCLPAINPERLEEIFSGATLPTHSIDTIDTLFPEFKFSFSDLRDAHQISRAPMIPSFRPTVWLRRFRYNPAFLIRMFQRKRKIDIRRLGKYYIRAAWGCRGNCSYCVIRKAVGPLKSKPISVCLDEMEEGLSRGVTNFVLEGDDLGAYGLDIGSNFADLLKNLLLIDRSDKHTVEIEEINPRWLVKYSRELIPLFREGRVKRLCCCLQSGSSRILKLMRRYHDIDEIEKTLRDIKTADPSILLSTHILVGFPGETGEEFEETVRIVEKIGFDRILVFRYQDRPGTTAANLPEKVSRREVEIRIRKIYSRLSERGVETVCV